MERMIANEASAAGKTPDDMRALYAEGTSLRKWVTARDVAQMAVFLASDAARMISGQAVAIDGNTERMT